MDIILYQYILQPDQQPLQYMLLGDWTHNTLRAMQGLAGTEGCHYFNGGLTPDVATSSPFMLYQSFWISYRKLFHTSSGILCKGYWETKAQLSKDLGFSLKTDNTTQ
jgi:hypothetical protein